VPAFQSLRQGVAVLLIAVPLLIGGPAQAADPAEAFYKGRQITIFVPTPPGGIYDIFGRLLGTHMVRHIPGQPTAVVQNMGGAGGLLNANHVANVSPKDGSVFAISHSSVPTALLLSPAETKFSPNELSWIGNITKDPFIAYMWHTSKVKKVDDLYTIGANVGGNAVGSAGIDLAILERKMFGFKLNIITGYTGPETYTLAIQRGETDGTMGNGYSDLKARNPDWLRDKKANIILQQALSSHEELAGIPVAIDLAKTEEQRQILQLLLARNEYRMPVYAPPGVPAERLAALRRAFDATMKDPEFLTGAQKAGVPVEGVLDGEALAVAVRKINATPKEVPEAIENIFKEFKDGK
jgi:tripartite-type tricarboxylate transporter receptor subunit TctC